MPSGLIQKIRIMKAFAVIELICLIISFITLALGAEVLLVGGSAQVGIVLFGLSVCSGIVIVCLSKYLKGMEARAKTYVVPLNNMSLEAIVRAFSASEIGDEGYISFQSIKKIHCRLLIQRISQFNSSVLAQQRKQLNRVVNTKYHVKSTVSMFEALSSLRINIIVCETSSPALHHYIGQNPAKLLSRNEAVVQAAFVLDEQVMLFPDCISDLSYNQVKRYQIAAHCVWNAIAAR